MSTNTATDTESEIKIEEPKRHKVILHNDNKTTFDFVISVLQQIFHKSATEAAELTFSIHVQGWAVIGLYTEEIAVEKVTDTHRYARANNFPLSATHEEA